MDRECVCKLIPKPFIGFYECERINNASVFLSPLVDCYICHVVDIENPKSRTMGVNQFQYYINRTIRVYIVIKPNFSLYCDGLFLNFIFSAVSLMIISPKADCKCF